MKETQVKIGNSYYDINDPNIVKDFLTGEYLHKDGMVYHLVDGIKFNNPIYKRYTFNKDDSKTHLKPSLLCKYTSIENYNKVMTNPSKYNVDIFSIYLWEQGFIEVLANKNEFLNKYNFVPGVNNTEVYYHEHEIKLVDLPKPYRKFDNTYYKKTVEDVIGRKVTREDIATEDYKILSREIMKRNQEMGVDSTTNLELEGIKVTLGHELETVSGTLSVEEAEGLNFKAVHDGSLRGPSGESPLGGEYVTGVLYGDAGFIQLHKICKILSKKCTIDHRAGNHVHVGSLNWNKEDVVYSYMLGEMVEDEMFSMLPKSRRNNSYCRKLTPITSKFRSALKESIGSKMEYDIIIDEMYNAILTETAGQSIELLKNVNRNTNHPKGSKCGYDKNSQRYCWLNYVTLLFNTKGVPNSWTLEFRSHSATLNYTKVKNWTKICVAFVNFVNNHKEAIRNSFWLDKSKTKFPVSLELMVKLAYPKRGNSLIDYIRERKEVFKTADESIDYKAVESTEKSLKEIIIPECV